MFLKSVELFAILFTGHSFKQILSRESVLYYNNIHIYHFYTVENCVLTTQNFVVSYAYINSLCAVYQYTN